MAWKEMTTSEIAKALGVDAEEVRQKQELIRLIVKERKRKRLSQADMAKKIGVTQGRIAQIESGIGTANISFEILFGMLTALGHQFKIVVKKVA